MGLGCLSNFENEATSYDDSLFIIPHYNEVIAKIIERVEFSAEAPIRVLDIGCGTGNLSIAILKRFPNATVRAIDFSQEMISVAESKLSGNDRICFFTQDMFAIDAHEHPYYDLIVSSFVLHNYEESWRYGKFFSKAIDLLSVDGRIVIGDLILCESHDEQEWEQQAQKAEMRRNGFTEDDVTYWINRLDAEDTPRPIAEIEEDMLRSGFNAVVSTKIGCTAVFSAVRPLDLIQVKSELLMQGIQETDRVVEIFYKQNPEAVRKTGNNGVFLILNDTMQVLASFLHDMNSRSPYRVVEVDDNNSALHKNNRDIGVAVAFKPYPKWYFTEIESNKNFSGYFVLEGDRYLHLAYKGCAFCEEEMCKFCSVDRRSDDPNNLTDHTAEDICTALDFMFQHNHIPSDFHFCLGGGTYLPLEKNVEFFCKIVSCIRKYSMSNPIWIEMIPPSAGGILRLIKAGATSFGFNIEILNEENRRKFCPGKSKEVAIQDYKDAFKAVKETLGANKIGSCILVGLDDWNGLKASVDMLVEAKVFPCVLALKFFDGAKMELEPQAQLLLERNFIELSKYAAQTASENNIDFRKNEGCLHCPCCTIIHDLLPT